MVLSANARMQVTGEGTETLTVYGALCPMDYAGDDYFADCYETPAAGAQYNVRALGTSGQLPSGGGFASAGADGTIAFTDLSVLVPGPVRLHAIAPPGVGPGGFTVPAARCTANDDRDVPISLVESRAVGQLISFEVQPGDDLRCDVYFVPLSLSSTEAPLPPDIRVYNLICPTTGASRTEFILDTSLFLNPPSEGYADCTANTEATFELSIQAAAGLGEPIQTRNTDINGQAFFPEIPGDEYYTLVQVGSGAEYDFRHGNDITYISIINYITASGNGETPAATTGLSPTPTNTSPVSTATTTTEPGHAAVISGGRCPISTDDLDALAELAGLTAPEGAPVGQEVEAIPETSFTTVALSLDALLADDHAIVIRADDGDEPDSVACGDLGGILNENGSLIIGLYAVNDSNLSGVAFLAPNSDDPEQTDVSLFLVEGLAADHDGTPPA